MKAARWFGRRDLRVCEVPEPHPGPREVKIEVKWCGICGSDVAEYEKGPMFMPKGPHPVTGKAPPITVGHEFSGVIVEMGEDVAGFEIGDRVVVDPYVTCGKCFWCMKKEGGSLCRYLNIIGFFSDGGFANYVCVPASHVYKIGSLSYDVAALAQPTVLGIHITKRANLTGDETALVVGAGPIGLSIIQAAKALGAQVIATEISSKRKEFARKIGADVVLDPKETDINKYVLELTDGIGADVAFECVGSEQTLKNCLDLARKGGRVVLVGFSDKPIPISVNELIRTKRSVIGTLGYGDEFPEAIKLLQETENVSRELITAKIKLDEIVEKGYEELIKNRDSHVKILVAPV